MSKNVTKGILTWHIQCVRNKNKRLWVSKTFNLFIYTFTDFSPLFYGHTVQRVKLHIPIFFFKTEMNFLSNTLLSDHIVNILVIAVCNFSSPVLNKNWRLYNKLMKMKERIQWMISERYKNLISYCLPSRQNC